ncbi:hypothetical protein BACCAP_00479 [Pseudoflavonifractor capillosus ATCC 29799]|uniref:Uncharacterized protein n=1 Tax=Pseudoflavonifractor capillosus ATCC 29799 TaxID=411467 RepID=A6NQK9_9FIRM|nr:hypothetical protein BACCAP_00479 [Pseudoflavonifractor capillosus ATCC 29799]
MSASATKPAAGAIRKGSLEESRDFRLLHRAEKKGVPEDVSPEDADGDAAGLPQTGQRPFSRGWPQFAQKFAIKPAPFRYIPYASIKYLTIF